jgi:hypothetical protein
MKLIYALFITLFAFQLSAADEFEKEIEYRPGMDRDYVELERYLEVTRYRNRQVQSTCYRQEPYQYRVCRNVTRYRRECRMVPGRRVCNTVYRRRCTVVNGQRRCRNVPVQQCRTTPSRRVCRDVPYTDRVCRYETRYRDVPYTCWKTIREPYVANVLHIGRVEINYLNRSSEYHRYRVDINEFSNIMFDQINNTQTRSRIADEDIDKRDDGDRIYIDARLDIEFY